MSEVIKKAATNEVVEFLYGDLRERSAPVIFNSATGNPVVFNDGANGLPVKSLKVNFSPIQNGSGDPSPENIRSIVPWNGLTVWNGGKNLLNPIWWDDIADNKSYVRYEDGTLVYQANTYKASDYVSVIGNIEYTLHAAIHGQGAGGIAFYDSSKQYISGIQINIGTGTDHTFTTPSNAAYMRFWDNGGEMPWNEVMLVYGSTAPIDYEPYRPITDTDIIFSSPIYGGEYEVVTGKLMCEWVEKVFDGSSDELWDKISSGSASDFAMQIQISGKSMSTDSYICNSLKNIPRNATWGNYDNWISDNQNSIVTGIKSITTVADWRAYLAEHPIAVVYKLATPQEIQLTPVQLQSLFGTNTIWSDANGDIEVEYRTDTELFLKQNTVKDVQINSISILNDGVANIPIANGSNPGVAKFIGNDYGIGITEAGIAYGVPPTEAQMKKGTNAYKPITASRQHISAFYALAKLAGEDMANSSNAVGTYTDPAKTAIQKMLGFDGILGDYELSTTASKAYAIGETFIFNGNRYRATTAIAINDVLAPGTNCVLDPIDGHYVKDADYGDENKYGLLRIASIGDIKAGNSKRVITALRQYRAVFYGLAEAAGASMASSSNEVGTYTAEAKAAIQSMLGIEADIPLVETVTGATVSITGMPNVRYICDTAISELTITPPASGSIVVRFTAGSNCIVSLPQTVKLPAWFDISSLEDGTTYEIIITDGVYGGVMSWA